MNHQVLRIVDANLNRATEGLRVAEDVCRYAWGNQGLASLLREARHKAFSLVDRGECMKARNVSTDVLAGADASRAGSGEDLSDLVQANLKRAEEAFRVLAEVLRPHRQGAARAFEELRYQVYHLEQTALARRASRLPGGLYLILNAPSERFEKLAGEAVSAKVGVIQLRCKKAGDRVFVETACRLRSLIGDKGPLLIVNDRVDIALMSGAHGVHLGQDDAEASRARDLMGPGAIIGLSTHTIPQVRAANTLPVDYIGFGPVFEPFSKQDHERPTGIEALEEAVRVSCVPVIAIGGIGLEHARLLRATGCHGIASIGAVERAADPGGMIRAMNTAFLEGS